MSLSISTIKGILCGFIFSIAYFFPWAWPITIIGYALFIYIIIETPRERPIDFAALAGLSFGFYFSIRILILRGIYPALAALLTSNVKALLVFGILCIYYSLHALFWGPLIGLVFRYTKSKFLQMLAVVFILVIANKLNIYFEPESHDLPLYHNQNILAALGVIGSLIPKLFLFLSAFLLAILFKHRQFKFVSVATIVLLLLLTIQRPDRKFMDYEMKNPQTYILVQTGQSNFNPGEKIDLEKIRTLVENKIKKIKNKLNNSVPIVIFPEYTFDDSSEVVRGVQKFQKELPIKTKIIAGFSATTDAGIKNETVAFNEDGQIVKRVGKVYLFPIGELAITHPLLPDAWTRPVIPILAAPAPQLIEYPDIVLMPMICYESALSNFYAELLGLASATENLKPKIFINLSKNSFLENTSALDYFDLFAQSRASLFRTPLIRVSTSGYTKIISSRGLILTSTKTNKLEILIYTTGESP